MSRENERCENCIYWHTYGVQGDCQRHAPTLVIGVAQVERAVWPSTGNHEWCGDWELTEQAGLGMSVRLG